MHNKLNHEPINGKRICLRLLEDRDVEQIRLWRNQDDIRKWFKDSRLIETQQQKAWYEGYKSRETDYLYIVEMRDLDRQSVGQLGINNIDWQAGSAEYGRLLAGDQLTRRKGIFYEASCLLLQYWKDTYGIVDYLLEVKTDNVRAISLYNQLGFKRDSEKDGFYSMHLSLK